MDKQACIQAQQRMILWAESLMTMDPSQWLKPIHPGKWSTGEIVTHLWYWDQFLLEKRLPYIQPGAKLHKSDNTEGINEHASRFARSGVTQEQIIRKFIQGRRGIKGILSNIPGEDYRKSFFIGDTSLTLSRYLKGLIKHDHHHREQVEQFIKKSIH